MQCRLCSRALRWDEKLALTLAVVEVAPGITETQNTHACPDCHALANGQEPPEPKTYPKGGKIPGHPLQSSGDMPICGLCRKALPWGQSQGEPMRLRAECLDADDLAAGIVPGDCFVSCRGCIQKYRPRILQHLQRLCRRCDQLDCECGQPYLPVGAKVEMVAGPLLM